jgi:hypothetical protein
MITAWCGKLVGIVCINLRKFATVDNITSAADIGTYTFQDEVRADVSTIKVSTPLLEDPADSSHHRLSVLRPKR